MNSERFEEIRRLVIRLESVPVTERAVALDLACGGDLELRREVESLLAVDDQGASDSPGLVATAGAALAFDRLGSPLDAEARAGVRTPLPSAIGRYRVLGLLGRGGMGEVFLAEQTDPIHRQVAVKRLRPGREGATVLERFHAERQVLARMEHPGIAHVFDAGSDEEGAPFIVMELVRGLPITEFAEQHRLSIRDRIRLFGEVCHAVQHAHQKGVLHRDLKPTNILVSDETGKFVSKIIDFGIAKPITDTLAPGWTLEGQLVGTLEYMSPEQLAGRTDKVDTRTDVYSLGVVLHELLTGQLPYDVRGKPVLEVIRLISDPSGRRRLRTTMYSLDADLVVILDKALSEEPDRRYPTASALAEDLSRWLDGQPILARAPSATYLIRKLIARNRVPAILVAGLFTLAVASAITLAAMFHAQRSARVRAEQETEKARAVSEFLRDMISSVESEGRDVMVREVLDVAARDVKLELEDAPEVRAAVRSALGVAYTGLSRFEEAEKELNAALSLRRELLGERHPEVAETMNQLAAHWRKRGGGIEGVARADSFARGAYEIRRTAFGADDRRTLESMGQYADARRASGDPKADSMYLAAIALAENRYGRDDLLVAELLVGRAPTYFVGGTDWSIGEAALREALSIYRQHYPGDHPRIADCLRGLTYVVTNAAEIDSLCFVYLAMQRRLWGEGSLDLCGPLERVGAVLRGRGQHQEALELMREALAIRERHYPEGHERIAGSRNSVGMALLDSGQNDEAAAALESALAVWEVKLGPEHTSTHICRTNTALAMARAGRSEEGLELLRTGLAMQDRRDPEHGTAGLYHRRLAEVLAIADRWADSERHARRAVGIVAAKGPGSPGHATALRALANSLHELGNCEEAAVRFASADSVFQVWRNWGVWSATRMEWCACLAEGGDRGRALGLLRESDETLTQALGSGYGWRADVLLPWIELLVETKKVADASSLLEECRELLPPNDPRQSRFRSVERNLAVAVR